jgi:hypothetical protein
MLARVLPGEALSRPSRPRVICLALGISGEELGSRLDGLLGELAEEPDEILVVTDAATFAPLLERGVGIEYVPPPDEVERHLPGEDHPALVRRRLGAILGGAGSVRLLGLDREGKVLSATLTARGESPPNRA